MAVIIRQEINLTTLGGTFSSGDLPYFANIVTANYEGTYTWYFEIIAKVASGSQTVLLHDSSDNVHATITVTETAFTVKRVECSTAPTTDTYHVNNGATAVCTINAMRIVCIQNAG